MYRFLQIGNTSIFLYTAINLIGSYVVMFYNDLRIKKKKHPLGYRMMIVHKNLSNENGILSRYLFKTLPVMESETFTMAYIAFTFVNSIFGEVFGTGANYFGSIFIVTITWVLLSFFYGVNPLEELDFISTCLPFYLIFIKLACFTSGCCYGIPWENGLLNTKYDEYQVPVQLIEAFWGLLIFIILTIYRKKAKTGTVFPMYIILYCGTRFFSEFLRHEENVLWILKTYHLLCLGGIVYGVVLWIIISKYRDRINAYYDLKYQEAEEYIEKYDKKNRFAKKKQNKKKWVIK